MVLFSCRPRMMPLFAPIGGTTKKGQIMNNKHNNKLAVLAAAVAVSAIGVGAVVSGNAMAGSDPAQTATDSVSVVSLGADGAGEAIECTFEGADLPGVFGTASSAEAPSPVVDEESFQVSPDSPDSDSDGVTGQGFSVSVDGVVTESAVTETEELPTDLGQLVEEGSASPASNSDAAAVPATELPEGVHVIDAAKARQGTADECADMLKDLTAAP
jgi:hypothetical protein